MSEIFPLVARIVRAKNRRRPVTPWLLAFALCFAWSRAVSAATPVDLPAVDFHAVFDGGDGPVCILVPEASSDAKACAGMQDIRSKLGGLAEDAPVFMAILRHQGRMTIFFVAYQEDEGSHQPSDEGLDGFERGARKGAEKTAAAKGMKVESMGPVTIFHTAHDVAGWTMPMVATAGATTIVTTVDSIPSVERMFIVTSMDIGTTAKEHAGDNLALLQRFRDTIRVPAAPPAESRAYRIGKLVGKAIVPLGAGFALLVFFVLRARKRHG